VIRGQDILKFLCRPGFQAKCELDRIQVHFLELFKIAALFQLPVLCAEVTLDFNFDIEVTGVFPSMLTKVALIASSLW